MKPISNMAFYCCGVRQLDAALAKPVCGDVYAKLFMDAYGQGICDQFKTETLCNASVIVRHRIIDDLVRALLRANPALGIVILGAGFDSRPYRLAGGSWFELDEPQVIAYKNERLPVSACPNPLRRVAVDFSTDSLEEKLSQISHDGPLVFILEGVFIYLSENEIRKLLHVLEEKFPEHQLICDLVDRRMVEGYGQKLRQMVAETGAAFQPVDQPESVFLRSGYRVKKAISIAEEAIELGINKMPKFILRSFFAGEIKGNAVYLFEKHDPYDDTAL